MIARLWRRRLEGDPRATQLAHLIDAVVYAVSGHTFFCWRRYCRKYNGA